MSLYYFLLIFLKIVMLSISFALQFLGKLEGNNKETFGFRSLKCPPVVDEPVPFELEKNV